MGIKRETDLLAPNDDNSPAIGASKNTKESTVSKEQYESIVPTDVCQVVYNLPQLISKAETDNDLIEFGPNRTTVSKKCFTSLKWHSPTLVTRQLLSEVFGRETLGTHSLSGKLPPASLNIPEKKRLDEQKVEDIISIVTSVSQCSRRIVRQAITLKCADESRLLKKRRKKLESVFNTK